LNPNNLWYIPLAIAAPGDWTLTTKRWIEPKNMLVTYAPVDTTKWIVVNPSATGKFNRTCNNYILKNHKVVNKDGLLL